MINHSVDLFNKLISKQCWGMLESA